MKRILASLLLASSLSTASATPNAAPSKPDIVAMPMQFSRAEVRAKLAERRRVMIARFLAYREARVYPWNRSGMLRPQHIWIDDFGNLCAAATLISGDWGRASTTRVGEKDRGIALANIKKGELLDWMLTSGLTHHEIVAIQVPPMGDVDDMMRPAEIERLYAMYTDVERQLKTLSDENLDLATDALMKRPDLARAFLAGKLPGPGKYFVEANPDAPVAPPADTGPAPMPEPTAPPAREPATVAS